MSQKEQDKAEIYQQGLALWQEKGFEEEFGSAESFLRLGLLYHNGEDMERDGEKAEYWLLRAAELDNSEANYWVAYIFYHDQAGEETRNRPMGKLYRDALKYALRAEELGDEDAEDLARQIRSTIKSLNPKWYWGDEVDIELVAALEASVLKGGDIFSSHELMRIYGCFPGHEMDGMLRKKRLLPLCVMGFAEAQYTLAMMYARGDGLPRDMENAVYWYGRAAERGHADAQCEMADMYLDGENVERNFPEAFRLYKLSAAKKNPFAELGLATMYELGLGTKRNINKAVYWYHRAYFNTYFHSHTALERLWELEDKFPEEYARGEKRYKREKKKK